MKKRRFTNKLTPMPCDVAGPDDGVDPRDILRYPSRRVQNRKALQLCSQVAQTLQEVLQGECDDEVLRDLLVQSVVPAPDSSRLLVTLAPSPASGELNVEEALGHLQQAYGKLRTEVGAAIHRKKVPELLFHIVISPNAIP